jgi:hypothetical protein
MEATTVVTPAMAEYTPAHRMIAAASRLRDAWARANLDVGEMHEAGLGLICATGTSDLASALNVLHDVESGHTGDNLDVLRQHIATESVDNTGQPHHRAADESVRWLSVNHSPLP